MLAGLDPAALLELDGPMWDAVERAALNRWTMLEELQAQAVELAYAHLAAYVRAAYNVKGRIPAFHIPRPGELEEGPPKLGALAFAAEYGPGASG